MITWWQHLSWSHATLVLLAALILLALLISILGRRLRCATLPAPPGLWPLVDYSARFQEKTDWLGDRHLLARSLNRQTRTVQ